MCTTVTSTQRADLDDKRVILPCWVGHLKDSHFFWHRRAKKYDREGKIDREDAGKCAHVCESVCGIEKKERAKTASGDGATRNRIFYGFFLYIYTCHASIAHTFLQYICSRTDLRKHANYIDKWANYSLFHPRSSPHPPSYPHMHSGCRVSISYTFIEPPPPAPHLPPLLRNVVIWFPRWFHLHESPGWWYLHQHWCY